MPSSRAPPNPRIEPWSPTLQGDSLPSEPPLGMAEKRNDYERKRDSNLRVKRSSTSTTALNPISTGNIHINSRFVYYKKKCILALSNEKAEKQ